jgi:tryptophanyl-tRNA synthetase
MKTKDEKIGVFIKPDYQVEKLLSNAESVLQSLGFSNLKKITEYKALYINDAKEEDITRIDQALVVTEPEFDGYGFIAPSATFHRFITGLTGEKMSSSKPESAIFLTDTPKDAEKKINHAKTGGAVSLEQQKKEGGKPDECMVYELFLYHLIDDDKELHQIYQSCKDGELMCGHCKKKAAEKMKTFLLDLAEKRKQAEDHISEYLS